MCQSSSVSPLYVDDSRNQYSQLLTLLRGDVPVVSVPSQSELESLAYVLGGSDLREFVSLTGRWPAVGEEPPDDYAGDDAGFRLLARAFALGLIMRVKEGFKLLAPDFCQKNYFAELDPADIIRFPLLPASTYQALAEYSAVTANAIVNADFAFLRSHRPRHPRPARVGGAPLPGRAPESADDLKKKAYRRKLVKASQV